MSNSDPEPSVGIVRSAASRGFDPQQSVVSVRFATAYLPRQIAPCDAIAPHGVAVLRLYGVRSIGCLSALRRLGNMELLTGSPVSDVITECWISANGGKVPDLAEVEAEILCWPRIVSSTAGLP